MPASERPEPAPEMSGLASERPRLAAEEPGLASEGPGLAFKESHGVQKDAWTGIKIPPVFYRTSLFPVGPLPCLLTSYY